MTIASNAHPPSTTLSASYSHCQRLAQRASSNFFLSFFLLPRAKRRAMCALYAFLRRTDDIGDNESFSPAQRQAALDQWRRSLDLALTGEFRDPIFPALADTLERFEIPLSLLHAVLDGVQMDIAHCHYATFEELSTYCRRVASAVGLACIRIWGYRGEAALAPAERCGVAFQLTNILRDLKEDAQHGRIYLPQEDLARFEITPEDLKRGIFHDNLRALMHFEIARTEAIYAEARPLEGYLSRDGRRIFRAMMSIYRTLLQQIKRRDGDVFSRRIRLTRWQRVSLLARACFGITSSPRFGERSRG